MKKTMVILTVAVMAAALVAQGTAFAWGGCGATNKCGVGGNKGKSSFEEKLNLTADQKTRLDASKAAHRDEMVKLRDAMSQKRSELQEAMAKPGATKEQVAPIVSEIKRLQAEMTDKRLDGIFAIKEILTPEQSAKLQEMKDKKMRSGHRKDKGRDSKR